MKPGQRGKVRQCDMRAPALEPRSRIDWFVHLVDADLTRLNSVVS
jgi:hypothetical protein